ncbi:LuxR family transcriptional regulator [Mycolicibacterium sphagni]|uniref:LuxR family transcriptional regulator n=1 Tax=Mycolicibacterium sphagni TaxID=1786 RepID=UPI0021F303C7|nr:LuxR family transcriptional regulator [Mycolicibacterium sphagni]MCV7179164.1 helix-turn-helix transcriptional regulator [Mycolicibacterium sphagni]
MGESRIWPVMRRGTELAAIQATLTGRAGTCGALLLGDAGVGKTTLARMATQSQRTGAVWVAGTDSAREVPLGVFAHLLENPMPVDPVAMLANAFHAVRRGKLAVIGIDDVHLVDHLSATLVHQLAVEGSVRIVATARTGEPIPDTITALWKDGYLARLDVTPFTKGEAVELVETALGGRFEQLSADLMWEASSGNALFVRHLVEGALEAGTLRQVNDVWQLRGEAACASTQLAPLISSRLDRLPDAERRALHLLAVSEPVMLAVMSELVDTHTLERIERRGLIRIIDDTGTADVHFTHSVIGEVIRQDLGQVASRRLRAEVLTAMDLHPPQAPAQRLRRAKLALHADIKVDTEFLSCAAEDAIALMNIHLAERLARAAIDQGGGLVASELLARTLLWQGRASESEEILASFDPDTLSEFDLARWGMARIANLQWSIGDSKAAAEILAMLQQRVSHRRVRLVVDGLAAALAVLDNRLEEAAALADQVLADDTAPPIAVGWAVFGGAMAAALQGRTTDAARLAARGHAIYDKIDGLLRFLLALGEVRALTLAGDFAAAQARSGDIVRITSPSQFRARAMANVLAGTVELGRGQLRAAMGRLEETLATLTGETAAWNVPARLLLVQCYCGLGYVQLAAPLLAELHDIVGRGATMFEPPVRLAAAWFAAAEGYLSGAIATALRAADLAAESGQRAIELMALHAAARFGDKACLPRVVEVASAIGGPLAEVDAAHAIGLMNSDGAAVFSASQEFERIGALLSAADAAAQAAALFDAAGRRRNSLEAAAAADRLGKACGGLKTPALCATSQPLPLSPREREVAQLVARGLTNKEIAARLVVSTRTVEGHLYRIYVKLNVTDRDDLGRMIRGEGNGDAPG